MEGEQKAALLQNVEQGQLSKEAYEEKKERAGIIGLVSDLAGEGPEIFDLFWHSVSTLECSNGCESGA